MGPCNSVMRFNYQRPLSRTNFATLPHTEMLSTHVFLRVMQDSINLQRAAVRLITLWYWTQGQPKKIQQLNVNLCPPMISQTFCDFSQMGIKGDCDRRPLWVTPDARIFLEANSPVYKQVDMLYPRVSMCNIYTSLNIIC